MEGRAAEIASWLERPALWREPCFSALTRDGSSAVATALDRLGDMRFRRKKAALVPSIRQIGSEETLWHSLLEALAFGPDREAFRLVAQKVSWVSLRVRLQALPAPEHAAEALRSLEAAFASLPPPRSAARRPANSPARRLEGAARLAARYAEKGLVAAFVDAFEEGRRQGECDEAKTEVTKTEGRRNHGLAPFRVSNSQFQSGQRRRSESRMISSLTAALMVPGAIGRGRAVEIIANSVLPWVAALGPEPRPPRRVYLRLLARARALRRRTPFARGGRRRSANKLPATAGNALPPQSLLHAGRLRDVSAVVNSAVL